MHGVWCLLSCYLLSAATATPARPSALSKAPPVAASERSDFLDIRNSGAYRFAYSTGDAGRHYHSAVATPDNTVSGRFGYRDPKTGGNLETIYTAGKRGFRAHGKHIHRHMDLSQTKNPYNPPVSPDSPLYNPSYSTYFDPNEDPSYSFGFRTPEYSRSEVSNSRGDVTGRYTFIDDVGVPHNVEYEAGSRVGFHVKTPYPDSSPLSPSVFFAGPPANKKGSKPVRGHTAIQRGKDGSYRFTSAGPDQRRTEVSDATGHVRGSYTYVDDKGVQRTTQYIAGPNIGYKVINTQSGKPFPVYPYFPYIPPFKETGDDPLKDHGIFDEFNGAESGHGGKPSGTDSSSGGGIGGGGIGGGIGGGGIGGEGDSSEDNGNKPAGTGGHDTSSETEDPWPSDIFGPTPPGTASSPKPGNFDIFGTPSTPSSGDKDEDEDIFGPEDKVPHKGDGSDFLGTGSSPPSNIPYGNCCKLGPTRPATDRRRSRRPELTQTYSHAEEDSDDFVGFPPGVPVRAHVQSIDLKTFGSRLPPPGTAIDLPDPVKSRRQTSSLDDATKLGGENVEYTASIKPRRQASRSDESNSSSKSVESVVVDHPDDIIPRRHTRRLGESNNFNNPLQEEFVNHRETIKPSRQTSNVQESSDFSNSGHEGSADDSETIKPRGKASTLEESSSFRIPVQEEVINHSETAKPRRQASRRHEFRRIQDQMSAVQFLGPNKLITQTGSPEVSRSASNPTEDTGVEHTDNSTLRIQAEESKSTRVENGQEVTRAQENGQEVSNESREHTSNSVKLNMNPVQDTVIFVDHPDRSNYRAKESSSEQPNTTPTQEEPSTPRPQEQPPSSQ